MATTPYQVTGDGVVQGSPGVLQGWSLRCEGATTKLSLRDGNGGEIIAVVNLAAGESVRDWFGPQGIAFNELYIDVAEGTPEGAIYIQ